MNQQQNQPIISLEPLQGKNPRRIQPLIISMVVTNQNMVPVKLIPLDNEKITTDIHYFDNTSLRSMIEEQYMSFRHLDAARVFLGITETSSVFYVYQELKLCKS